MDAKRSSRKSRHVEKELKILFFFLLILSMNSGVAQFTGKPGVYFLGAADIPVASSKFSNPDISGVVCRFKWESLEATPGNFDWTFIDGEIAKANASGKKISLQPLGYPDWIIDSLHAQPYYYIDENPSHPTYGQIINGVLTWDSIYLSRVSMLMQQLALKYAADTNISYLNFIAAQVSRNLPDTVVTDTTLGTQQPFWIAFDYDADTLATVMQGLIDEYMNLFPSTPLWCSVDYVKFEFNASARPINYLASLYTDHGLSHYPDRFGLFREDLSGCNPQPVINSGSHWYIMQQHPCATGAQMLWNVQDGPDRMNQCNMIPNTKSFVLDSAVQHGLTLGMRYMEIYGADIDDSSLTASVSGANTGLISLATQCNPFTGLNPSPVRQQLYVYPNPSSGEIHIDFSGRNNLILEIFDSRGRKILCRQSGEMENHFYFTFPEGIYLAKVTDGSFSLSSRFIVVK